MHLVQVCVPCSLFYCRDDKMINWLFIGDPQMSACVGLLSWASWFPLRGNSNILLGNERLLLDLGELNRINVLCVLLFTRQIWSEALFFVTLLLSSVMPGTLSLGALGFKLAMEIPSHLLLVWEEAVSWLCGMWGVRGTSSGNRTARSLYQCLPNISVFTIHLAILLKCRSWFSRSGGAWNSAFLTGF